MDMKEIKAKILRSFDTKEGGFSSRKLTAFVIVIMVIIIHIKWLTLGNLSQIEMVLTIDYGFIGALFGLTTYQSIKNKKSDVKQLEEVPIEEITETPNEKN
jgi:hypothetical protein